PCDPSTKNHAGGTSASSLLRGYHTLLHPPCRKVRTTFQLLPGSFGSATHSCLRNWLRWLCRTRKSSMVCCYAPAQKLYSKWLATLGISVPRSAYSVCYTPGTRNSNLSSCPLRYPSWWALSRSLTLDSVPSSILSPHPCASTCI